MTRTEAVQLTQQTLKEHNLNNWGVRIATSGRFLGMCSHQDKIIFLNSLSIDTHPDNEIRNIILHEIAHALTPGHAHDEVWKAKARELGCDNTQECGMALNPIAIDAIRSGQLLEYEVEETVIRTPKYKVTRLQDKCPVCGKVAKEESFVEIDEMRMITLECGHMLFKELPKQTPFHTMVSNSYEDLVANCQHNWIGTTCLNCLANRAYAYQVEGMRFLERALALGRGGAIFDEPGLGKTIQVLGLLKFHPELFPVLFIVKATIKYQWLNEIMKWLGPEYFAQIISSGGQHVFKGPKCYITTYDLLRRFEPNKLEKIGIKTIVLDECQAIKNVDSTRTHEVRKLIKTVQNVIALSGTPWKNRGSEFFPVLNMLDSQKFHSYENYKRRWVQIYWDGNRMKEGGINNPKMFKEYIKDIAIRRERAEVMPELPLVSRNRFHTDIEQYARDSYNEEVKKFVEWYTQIVIDGEEDSGKTAGSIIAKMARMRHVVGLAKMGATADFVLEHLEETGRKIVVFAHHTDVQELLYTMIQKDASCRVLRLTADLTAQERQRVCNEFNETEKVVLVASTLASGEGLNLQTCCDCIIHERQWNPANEEQAEGRFIRIGQKSQNVIATYMHAERTIDPKMDQIIERKRINFHAAMNNGEMIPWNVNEIVKELADSIVEDYRKGA